jgi:Domain of unknown function (DUF4129)
MNRCLFCALVLLSVLWSATASGAAQEQPSEATGSTSAAYHVPSFAAELHRLATLLEKNPSTNEMAALRDSLPRRWTVSTPERTYSISSEPLRNQLTALSSQKARLWAEHLATEVENSSAPHVASSPQARSQLERILAGSEFAGVRPPSAWELFRRRIELWLARMFLRFFGVMGRHPIGGTILFWLLVVVAVGCIALWLFRFLSSRDRMDSLPLSASVVASRTWQEWIRAAREAAGRGDFREAVHSAYWAGIVRLEDSGVVPKDRTKTPREYLRLVAEPHPGELASRPSHREPLAALTSRLERIWYANRAAGPEDFRDSLRQLEALGCPLE